MTNHRHDITDMANMTEIMGCEKGIKSWEEFMGENTQKLETRAKGLAQMQKLMDKLNGDASTKAEFFAVFKAWRDSMTTSYNNIKANSEILYLDLVEAINGKKMAEEAQAKHAEQMKIQDDRYKAMVAHYDDEREKQNKQLEDQRASYDTLAQESRSLKNALAHQEQQVEELEKKLGDRNDHLETIKNLNTVIDSYIKDKTRDNDELERLRKYTEISAANIIDLLQEIRRHEEERETLRKQIDSQKVDIQGFESAKNELETRKAVIDRRNSTISEMGMQIMSLKGKINDLETKIKKLQPGKQNIPQNTGFIWQPDWAKRHHHSLALLKTFIELSDKLAHAKQQVKDKVTHGRRIDKHRDVWIISGQMDKIRNKLCGIPNEIDSLIKIREKDIENTEKFVSAQQKIKRLEARIEVLQAQRPMAQGANVAGATTMPPRQSRMTNQASKAIARREDGSEHHTVYDPAQDRHLRRGTEIAARKVDANSAVVAMGRGPNNGRAAQIADAKAKQTPSGLSSSKRHASPKGAQDLKRAKTLGSGGWFSLQRKD